MLAGPGWQVVRASRSVRWLHAANLTQNGGFCIYSSATSSHCISLSWLSWLPWLSWLSWLSWLPAASKHTPRSLANLRHTRHAC
eukprot:COSAG02_NODE_2438_length_8864_cov_23.127781_2_plen_84_part_00